MTQAPSICARMRSGIDVRAAIDRDVDARHRQVALVVDRHLDDGRDVGHEAAMRGDAEPVARRHRAAPFGALGGELDDAAAGGRRRSDRRRSSRRSSTDSPASDLRGSTMRGGPISASSASFGRSSRRRASSATKDWIAKACGMFDTERNQPIRVIAAASPFSIWMLATSNGTSTSPMPSSRSHRCFGSGPKSESDARRHAAVAPRDRLAARVQPGLDALDRDGVVEAVVDVVLARPLHLDRRAAHLAATGSPPRSRSRASTCARTRRPAASR